MQDDEWVGNAEAGSQQRHLSACAVYKGQQWNICCYTKNLHKTFWAYNVNYASCRLKCWCLQATEVMMILLLCHTCPQQGRRVTRDALLLALFPSVCMFYAHMLHVHCAIYILYVHVLHVQTMCMFYVYVFPHFLLLDLFLIVPMFPCFMCMFMGVQVHMSCLCVPILQVCVQTCAYRPSFYKNVLTVPEQVAV